MRALLLLFSILFLMGTGELFAEADCFGNNCMPKDVQSACIEKKPNGCIDWTNGVIYATGMGVPKSDAKSPAQGRFSAIQAAKVVGMRNLLQMVQETSINSTTTVKDGMLENDQIDVQVQGKIKQVEQINQNVLSDGSVIVTLKMYLNDIMSILYNNEILKSQAQKLNQAQVKASSMPATAPADSNKVIYGGDANVIYTGLIIDARGTGVKPALSPKVYGPAGKEVYGSAAVDREFALKQGIVGYAKDMTKAKGNDRVKGNPLIIKATIKPGAKSSDLVLSKEDAELLRQVESTQTFLREARVLLLIS